MISGPVLRRLWVGSRAGGRGALWGERVKREPLARVGARQGDARRKRSAVIGARTDRGPCGLILGLVAATPDITLEELRTALAARGLAFGYGTLWRFFARHAITRKKRLRTRVSKTAPTS